MKKIHLLLLTPLFIAACQNKSVNDNAVSNTDDTLKLPYEIKNQQQWEITNDKKSAFTALSALKAFEKNDTTAMGSLLADTVTVHYDGGEFTGTKADFLKALKPELDMMKNAKITVNEWQSVTNKDKSENWVSVWYKQYWQNEAGKTDSLDMLDEMQIKNGKIIKWQDYTRHFTPPAQ